MIIADLGQNAVERPGERRKRYGYRVKVDESDPDNRVEYILDAVDMTPAHMDFEKKTFDYGSWKDVWFVRDNYPVMLKPDGTEDYRLSPSDYSKKLDGTTSSDLTGPSGDNAMAAIPLCWVERYEEDGYQYVIFCQEQYDAGYKAYAHTRPDGTIAPVAYYAMFEGSLNGESENQKLRSVSGDSTYPESSLQASVEVEDAKRNGEGWYVGTWALWSLIGDLLTLMSKSTNSQAKFGQGHTTGADGSKTNEHYNFLHCGTLNNKGQFYGESTGTTTAVKVFHIENFWGNRWDRIAGLLYINGIFRTKMTPEGKGYNLTGEGYEPAYAGVTGASGSYQKMTIQTELGKFPITLDGFDSTCEADAFWYNNGGVRVPLVGGSCRDGSRCGSRCLGCHNAASLATWDVGASLSYISPF